MAYYLLVVEGAHDAAFFGRLLRQRNFNKINLLSDVDSYWKKLIPTQFPADTRGRLDHVVSFPDIYELTVRNQRASIAIQVAGGESKLVPEFQAALEILDITRIRAAAIVSDADDLGVTDRVARLLDGLNRINAESVRNSVAGFPLVLPANPGFAGGTPRVGIHVLPDNNALGTLETILLECAATSYPRYKQPAIDFVTLIDTTCPAGIPELEFLRRGSGRQKAAAGMIGNLLFPGFSLSVAIDRGSWLEPVVGAETGLVAANGFLDSMLQD